MQPEVTAVITTHARPAAVREALASLEAEQFRNVEVVVVDDGGTFEGPPGLHIVRGSRLGVARARNLGLAAASGEFVIYLDDDDVALPNRISCLLAAARNQHAALCFGMTRRVVNGTSVLPDVPTHVLSPGAAGFSDLLTCAPHVNAVLARTDVLRAAGGFDEGVDHFDDWAAWLRLADRGAAIWQITETVAEWRVHPAGLSGTLLHAGAMKTRLLALFRHLAPDVTPDNARALDAARETVEATEIVTYDDYADAMSEVRQLPWY